MTSGSDIKLDLVEFIQVVDYVNTEVGLQERASCIVPVTARGELWQRLQQDVAEQLQTIISAEKGSYILTCDKKVTFRPGTE